MNEATVILEFFRSKHPDLVVESISFVSGDRYLVDAPAKRNNDAGISNMYLFKVGAQDAAPINPADDIDEYVSLMRSAKKIWPSAELIHSSIWRWR